MRLSSVALLASVALYFHVGCQTTEFTQGAYRLAGDYVVLEDIGFRGVAMEVPEGFRYVFDFTTLDEGDWRKELFLRGAEALDESEGLDYHFYEPIGFIADNPDVAILVTPGFMKRFPVTFAQGQRDEKERFVRSFALQGRFGLVTRSGYTVSPSSTENGRSYARVSNVLTSEPNVYEERIVLGNSNEFFVITAKGPLDQRSRLNETLETLIASFDFHPAKLPPPVSAE